MPKNKKSQVLIDFKPKIIISNILMISSAYYIINIFFTIFFNSFFGIRLHISQIISDKALDFSSSYGSAYLSSLFFTNVFMIAIFVFIVDKARNILDFVLTNFFIHLILCTVNSGFPSKFIWWVIQTIILTLVTLVSEFISLKIEQKEIKLDFSVSKKVKISDSLNLNDKQS
jgi:hypothetical protein